MNNYITNSLELNYTTLRAWQFNLVVSELLLQVFKCAIIQGNVEKTDGGSSSKRDAW